MNYSTDFPSVRDSVSAEEWQTRCDLAACYRLMDCYGMTDLIYNHITARVPGTEHLLINLYGLLYKEITADTVKASEVPASAVPDLGASKTATATAAAADVTAGPRSIWDTIKSAFR